MNYKEFCKWVEARLKEEYGEEGTYVEIRSVRKNNGVVQDGIFIRGKDCNVAPTIYLREFYSMYENGMEPEGILEKIMAVYEENKREKDLDFSFFRDFEQVRERLAFELVNKETNKELLQEIPWIPVLDLALVFYCILPEVFSINGTILINNDHCKDWGVDAEALYDAAKENTPRMCPPLLIDMREMLFVWERIRTGEEPGQAEKLQKRLWKPVNLSKVDFSQRKKEECMLILTNELRNLGAGAIFYNDLLKEISKKLESDLYILPSSIHECIILPVGDETGKNELEELVQRVNRTQVLKEERLSDHVYRYIREKDEII